jgi:hypothetical protein
METLNAKLSNAQLEILKLFSTDLTPDELADLKKILQAYKLKRVVDLADQVWDEKGWTQETMDDFLKTHMRTPYRQPQSEESN